MVKKLRPSEADRTMRASFLRVRAARRGRERSKEGAGGGGSARRLQLVSKFGTSESLRRQHGRGWENKGKMARAVDLTEKKDPR